MTKPIVHHPHDKLFRSSLQDPQVAKEFLLMHLPENIKNQLDLTSITYCQTTFVDEELKLSQTDVLFKVKIAGKDSYIYVLAEHESEVDQLIAFWLYKYMISIWHYHIQEVGENKALPLPMIFPLVFYTGDGKYTAKRHIWELFGENSDSMREIFKAPFHLIEVGKLPEEILTSNIFAGTMGFILRKYFRKHIVEEFVKIIDNFNQLETCKKHRYLLKLIKYVFVVDEDHKHAEELLSLIRNKMSPDLEKKFMGLAERLIQQGVQQGEEKGREKGQNELIQQMIARGVDPVFIAKNTSIPLERIKAFVKKDKK